ncbi:hypothetical protein M0R04_05590 [Candidatus Dojkabacteria bacterium]|jgi:hypothetical protein|nr:hypothetical protein [Candidatus Dojkabacteria bacterium]
MKYLIIQISRRSLKPYDTDLYESVEYVIEEENYDKLLSLHLDYLYCDLHCVGVYNSVIEAGKALLKMPKKET